MKMNNNLIKCIALFFSVFALIGCGQTGPDGTDAPDVTPVQDEDFVENETFTTQIYVNFADNGVVVSEDAEITVTKNGNNIDIKSPKKNVEYILSGETENGSVRIYSDYKFKLLLNGVNIKSKGMPALNIQSSKRAYIVLGDGTENILTDSEGYLYDKDAGDPLEGPTADGEDKKGCFFSEGQLVFSGKGTLKINGKNKHAIACDEYIRVREGNIIVNETADDGINVKEYYLQDGGNVSLNNIIGKGIKVREGYFTMNGGKLEISTDNDGIYLSYGFAEEDTDTTIKTDFILNKGTVNIVCNKQKSSAYGIKTNSIADLKGGSLDIFIFDESQAILSKDIILDTTSLTIRSESELW